MDPSVFGSAACGLFGILFAGVGALKMLCMAVAKSYGTPAIGRVVRFEAHRGSQTVAYAPVVEFQADNRTIEVRGWASWPVGCQVGEEVPVYYLSCCPGWGQIVSGRDWLFAWVFLAAGMLFLFVGLVIAPPWVIHTIRGGGLPKRGLLTDD